MRRCATERHPQPARTGREHRAFSGAEICDVARRSRVRDTASSPGKRSRRVVARELHAIAARADGIALSRRAQPGVPRGADAGHGRCSCRWDRGSRSRGGGRTHHGAERAEAVSCVLCAASEVTVLIEPLAARHRHLHAPRRRRRAGRLLHLQRANAGRRRLPLGHHHGRRSLSLAVHSGHDRVRRFVAGQSLV
jgi:hypothetical protein